MASSLKCPHLDSTDLRTPNSTTPVHKDECTQCFDTFVSKKKKIKER